ncbi:hypothetical protein I8748_26815 [Nostoc sp. CENA67]|uniref:Uncharacterized protein n=1 Tax=Amazonocrinis nigriterrae CENA67 TaxID=2794033 RepID=A0A8J7HYA4_9NOST|nr:hypothetical protein [Amazonocrinis nigriterrae]MBH8565743.1 hypothetical protein [Amazonocrinis nigriterrae CENA67]
MSQSNENNEILKIFLGILLLLFCHSIALVIVFTLGYLLQLNSSSNNYIGLQVWIIGGVGFLFWQLIYVIPLCIWLQRRQQAAIKKGVIIGAAITALLNGGCFLLFTFH